MLRLSLLYTLGNNIVAVLHCYINTALSLPWSLSSCMQFNTGQVNPKCMQA